MPFLSLPTSPPLIVAFEISLSRVLSDNSYRPLGLIREVDADRNRRYLYLTR